MVALKDRISPQINCLRSFLFLTIAHHLPAHPINDIFALFTSAYEGRLDWLHPFLASYQLVTSKFS